MGPDIDKADRCTGSGLVGLVSGPVDMTVVQFSMFCSTAKEETEGGSGVLVVTEVSLTNLGCMSVKEGF